MEGLVLKRTGMSFTVRTKDKALHELLPKGTLRGNAIVTGDRVVFNEYTGIITEVLPRKNRLVRPPIANIDTLVIMVAGVPKPDYLLMDKLILLCLANHIKPIICNTKYDLDDQELIYIQKVYGKYFTVVEVSAKVGYKVNFLKKMLKNQISAFAGQSGVGKSSLLNAMLGREEAKVDVLSARIMRGKQTTRSVELYEVGKNTFVADTSGFSSLDERYLAVSPQNLGRYYPEYMELMRECRFNSCNHISEPDCMVKEYVSTGKLDIKRYKRYRAIYENLVKVKQGHFQPYQEGTFRYRTKGPY